MRPATLKARGRIPGGGRNDGVQLVFGNRLILATGSASRYVCAVVNEERGIRAVHCGGKEKPAMDIESLIILALLAVAAAPTLCAVLLVVLLRRQRRHEAQLNDLKWTVRATLDAVRMLLERTATPSSEETGDRPTAVEASQPSPATEPAAPESEEAAAERPLSKPAPAARPCGEGRPEPPPVPVARGRETHKPVSKTPSSFPARQAVPESERSREPSAFEKAAHDILRKIWNWIIVGEEHRPENVSVEFAVATNWLVRLGILVLVVGVGLFLKYAIEAGLLPPRARVSLSILAGVAMIVAGIRILRGKYRLLGQGLIGGGLAVLYFSIYAAFSFYGFLSQGPALVLMAVVTVSAGLLAMRLDSLLIALLGLIGGYGTPVMLSTGDVNFPGLYTYLLLLGCGVFLTAVRKNWYLLNALSLLVTYALAVTALIQGYEEHLFWTVLPFFAAFFALFSTMTFIHNVAGKHPSTLFEVLALFVNAGVFFTIGYLLIRDTYAADRAAWLTIALSAFYTAHVYILLKRRQRDRGLLLSFLALAAFFLSITMPLVLSRSWITVSWAVQALVMLWIAKKLQSRFLGQLSYLIYLLVLGRFLFLDLGGHYAGTPPSPDAAFTDYLKQLVERVVAFGVPIASFVVGGRLLQRDVSPASSAVDEACDTRDILPRNRLVWATVILVAGMIFAVLQLEVNRSLAYLYEPLRMPMLTVLWVGLGLVLLRVRLSSHRAALQPVLVLAVAAMVVKLFFVDLNYWQLDPGTMRFQGPYSPVAAVMRLLDFGVVIGFGVYAARSLPKSDRKERKAAATLGYGSLALLFVVLTLEVNTCLGTYVPGLRAGGVTILWALFALSLLIAGILNDVRPLRYTGLGAFALVVIKIFLADLDQLEPLYRILAFISLGLVTLSGSFVYLKFRQTFEKEPSDDVPT